MIAKLSTAELGAYLDRVGLAAPPAPTAEGLAALLRAHRLAIPFENLDIAIGRGIHIAPEAVFAKLVTRRRGGYCFEQNQLFLRALQALGFVARPLLARVLLGAENEVTPRSHVLLLVDMDGTDWIADAGFGGSDLPPLPLADGAEATSPDGAAHRLLRAGARGDLRGEWRLERAGPHGATDGRAAPHADWQAQYVFDLMQVDPIDLEQANHWTATRPGTRFTTLRIASAVLPDGFAALTDRALRVRRGETEDTRLLADADDCRQALAAHFGLALSAEEVAALGLF